MALIYAILSIGGLLFLYGAIVFGYNVMTEYYIARDMAQDPQEIGDSDSLDDGFFMSAMYLNMGNDL